MEIKREKVLGFDVDLITLEGATELICDRIQRNEGMQIITVNPEMIELGNKNEAFGNALRNAELVVADGSGIRLALRLKGIIQEPVPGIELAKRVIQKCSENNIKIALIGAKEEVLQKTTENLKKEFPSLDIAYARNGYFNDEDEEQIITDIKNSGAKFILVALGAPKQEFFIQKCRKTINYASFAGVGGSFDVWAGIVTRAPEIFRKFGCEWLYRTLSQPQRIKRVYKTLPMFLVNIIIESMKKD